MGQISRLVLFQAALLPLLLSGCHSSSGSSDAPSKQVEPEKTNWTTVVSAEPSSISGLKFWVKADSIADLKDGARIKQWRDSVSNSRVLEAIDVDGPVYVKKAFNGKPAVRFSGENDLESTEVPGSIFGAKEATFFLVMNEAKNEKLRDLFGWGDCVKNRFLMHSSSENHSLFFQSGDPLQARVDGNSAAAWSGTPHIFAASRDGSDGEILLDGMLIGQARALKTSVDTSVNSTFYLGNSACNNRFVGEIAEMMIFDRALSKSEIAKVIKHLSSKYRIPLK